MKSYRFYFRDVSTRGKLMSCQMMLAAFYKRDPIDSSLWARLLSVPFLLRCLSLISIRLFHGQMIKPLSGPIQKLSPAISGRVTINFLQRQSLRCSLSWDYISLSISIRKCIFHKRPWGCCAGTRGCMWFPSVGPRAVSLWRWQTAADDSWRCDVKPSVLYAPQIWDFQLYERGITVLYTLK